MKKLLGALVLSVVFTGVANAGVWFNVATFHPESRDHSFYTPSGEACERLLVKYTKRGSPYWTSCSIKPLPGSKLIIPKGARR